MISISFVLSRNGQKIGHITWSRETVKKRGFNVPVAGSGYLSGDEIAVNYLQQAINRAIDETWGDLSPEPHGSEISDPLAYETEMLSVLDHAGFDIPPEFDDVVSRMRGVENPPSGLRY